LKRLIAFFIVGFFLISIGNAFAETHSSSTSKGIQVDGDVFVVSYSGITYVKIFGNTQYGGGDNIILTVTNPDGSTEEIKTRSSSDGYYETLLGYDRNDIMGIYNVFATYYGGYSKIGEISFELTDKSNPVTPKQPVASAPQPKVSSQNQVGEENKSSIPSWIKNISGFWVIDQISDEEYLTTIAWLIDNGVLKVSTSNPEVSQSKTESFEDKGDFKINHGEATVLLNQLYYIELIASQEYEAQAEWLNRIFFLPEDITITLAECDTINAFYDRRNKEITICYELMNFVYDFSNFKTTSSEKQSEIFDGILSFILMHELGHALIDVYDLPITGMEEDAVDQLATILMLDSPQSAVYLVHANSYFLFLGTYEVSQGELRFWDEHSFSLQRFYNMQCMMYGKFHDTEVGSVIEEILPYERQIRCEDEYQQVLSSWKRLLEPYANPEAIEYFFKS